MDQRELPFEDGITGAEYLLRSLIEVSAERSSDEQVLSIALEEVATGRCRPADFSTVEPNLAAYMHLYRHRLIDMDFNIPSEKAKLTDLGGKVLRTLRRDRAYMAPSDHINHLSEPGYDSLPIDNETDTALYKGDENLGDYEFDHQAEGDTFIPEGH